VKDPFTPQTLPPVLDWERLVRSIGTANATLARYDGLLQGLVNPDILLAPLRTREAVLSSRIEGTQASLEEVMEHEADPGPEERTPRYADIQEIINYRTAILLAVDELQERPISLNLIRRIHGALMDSVRGHDKGRGNFRRVQNFIGAPGADLEAAAYIPPAPEKIMPLLDNLEKYIHVEERDPLVQTALVHAQFELVHPFVDGNGRVGRILIPLILYAKGLVGRPAFYMSSFLEANRDEYYDRLAAIPERGDYQEWVSFFLRGMIDQAREDIRRIRAMLQLYDQMKVVVAQRTRSQFGLQALDTLFTWPVFSTPQFSRHSGIPAASAARLLKELEGDALAVTRPGRGRRPTLWTFPALLEIVR